MTSDENRQLEEYARTHWYCGACGRSWSVNESVCEYCLLQALQEDQQKLEALRGKTVHAPLCDCAFCKAGITEGA